MSGDKQSLYQTLQPYLLDPMRPNREGRIWSYCPGHADGTKHQNHDPGQQNGRSLSLHPTIGLTCFGPCDWDTLYSAFKARGWQPAAPPPPVDPKIPVYVYKYVNREGVLIAEKARFERRGPHGEVNKAFSWRTPGQTAWKDTKPPVPVTELPLYGICEALAEVVKDPETWVYFVEGEKARDACVAVGLVAVTAGVGATKTPALAVPLEDLRGMRVALWPDNDPPGHDYMAAVRGLLQPIAREIRWITVPVGEKEDAYDFFFKRKGTVQSLEQGLTSSTPTVLHLPHGLRIVYPTEGHGPITFSFDQITRAARELDTRMVIHLASKYIQRVNILSLSSRQTIARELKAVYGADYGWERILVEVFALVDEAIAHRDPIIDVIDIAAPARQEWHINSLLPLGENSVLFGPGGSGKTYLGLFMQFACATGGRLCGLQAMEGPTLWVDYENPREGIFRYRVGRISEGFQVAIPRGRLFYMRGHAPLVELLETVERRIQQEGITFLGVDSALKAVGGKVRDEAEVGRYFHSLNQLGITTLTLAHVTKDDNPDSPFGSVYWINEPHGRVWYCFQSVISKYDYKVLGMVNKKASDGGESAPMAFGVAFDSDSGPVSLTRENTANLPDLEDRSMSEKGKILDLLRHGAKTIKEIADHLQTDETKARYILRSHDRSFIDIGAPRGKGNVWGLRARA